MAEEIELKLGGPSPELIEQLKAQLLLALVKRCAVNGELKMPVSEIDGEGWGTFKFTVDIVTQEFTFSVEGV